METLIKRLKSAAWVALGGFIATAVSLSLEHISEFHLSPTEQSIAVIIGTAVVTQITKSLNKK